MINHLQTPPKLMDIRHQGGRGLARKALFRERTGEAHTSAAACHCQTSSSSFRLPLFAFSRSHSDGTHRDSETRSGQPCTGVSPPTRLPHPTLSAALPHRSSLETRFLTSRHHCTAHVAFSPVLGSCSRSFLASTSGRRCLTHSLTALGSFTAPLQRERSSSWSPA